jgi:hypothetical protein
MVAKRTQADAAYYEFEKEAYMILYVMILV